MSKLTKICLDESELPTHWYNIVADLPKAPAPILHPGTREPITAKDLEGLLPAALIDQELSRDRFIAIPDVVRDIYKQWRPTPLFRARRLERALNTPAKIFYKYEGGSPAGSHKPNTALAQAYYNHEAGIKKLTTETGAGQWGSALAWACSQFDMECEVWQVRASVKTKPYRETLMRLWGAKVHASPSTVTEVGQKLLQDEHNHNGSLGMAISEAVEVARSDEKTNYALGSVLNHVLLHQTVIGEEAVLQMAKADATPSVIIGCTGGGSNFAGLVFPFLRERWEGKNDTRIVCAEPAACASLTRGEYRYDFADAVGMTPLLKMHTLGHAFVPDTIHAGGLRYHGMAPLISQIVDDGLAEAKAFGQLECFQAAQLFAKTEGIVPAPEPTHALAAVIREAKEAKESGEGKVILTALCGHGLLDLSSYEKYLDGSLEDTHGVE